MTNKDINSISIVIPVYNSADILPQLVHQIDKYLPTIADVFEIVLVNDGSRDNSWHVVQCLSTEFYYIRGFNLMRNFGQHNALLCGIRAARYEIIVTMDDDLQHPPSEIQKLIAALNDGFDVVYGTPRALPHSFIRNILSRFTKIAMAKAMGIKNVQDISAFRAFRTELRDAFSNYQSPSLLVDVLLAWGTSRFTAVEVEHAPRLIGSSNYTFGKLFNQAMLILTGFTTGPLRVASLIGFVFTIFGLMVLLYVTGRYIIEGGSVPGFPFLASVIAIFSGAQLFALGIIGEYLARMFNRSMERPIYVVRETTEVMRANGHE